MSRKEALIVEDIAVSGYAAEGKALGKLDGKVLFITGGAVPGDRVDLRILKNKADWAEAKVLRFRSYSPDRTEPFCSHFGVCGGCQWQMLPYALQLSHKQSQVEQTLRRIGGLCLPELRPILGAERTTCYRNKLEFTFSHRGYLSPEAWALRQEAELPCPALGFHIPGLFDKVLDIQTCWLQAEPSNLIRLAIRQFALDRDWPFYDLRGHQGWLRNLMIRISTLGGIMVHIIVAYEAPDRIAELAEWLLDRVPEISTLLWSVNAKRNDSLEGLEPKVWKGPGYILEQLGEFRFRIGPKSFFQTNTYQAEVLYRVISELAGLRGTETVYDLYCGTGSIGIYLSSRASRILGIELVAEAVSDARQNALLNGVGHAEFLEGDVTEIWNHALLSSRGPADLVVTDPPRAGMAAKLVEQIREMAPPRIIYVSCNPATQARDLSLLRDQYQIRVVQPLDLFPHTHHIENVILLEKN